MVSDHRLDAIDRRAFLSVSALATAGLATACTSSSVGTKATQGNRTLVIGQVGTSVDFSPRGAINNAYPIQAVYDDFLHVKDDTPYDVKPWIVKDWKYSQGNTVLSMNLQEGVKFTDGTPLDAKAVAANVENFRKDPVLESYYVLVKEVKITGDHSLDFVLTKPWEFLLIHLEYLGALVSPAALNNMDKVSTTPVGSGPYILDAAHSTTNVTYQFNRNPNYWKKEAVYYDTVIVKQFADPTALLNALLSGQIDFAGGPFTGVQPTAIATVKSKGLQAETMIRGWCGLRLGDMAGKLLPPLADLRVRRAINMAFDREEIAKSLYQGHADPSDQAFTPGWAAYDPSQDGKYAYDPGGAKKLLAAAGYADGFSVTIPTDAANPDMKNLLPTVQQSLGDIGIKVSWKNYEDADYAQAQDSGKFPIILVSNDDALGTTQNWLRRESVHNPWHYEKRDPTVANLIDQSSAAETTAKRDAIQKKLGAILLDDCYFAVFAHTYSVVGAKKGLTYPLRKDTRFPHLLDIKPS